jgi:hypothetical protein
MAWVRQTRLAARRVGNHRQQRAVLARMDPPTARRGTSRARLSPLARADHALRQGRAGGGAKSSAPSVSSPSGSPDLRRRARDRRALAGAPCRSRATSRIGSAIAYQHLPLAVRGSLPRAMSGPGQTHASSRGEEGIAARCGRLYSDWVCPPGTRRILGQIEPAAQSCSASHPIGARADAMGARTNAPAISCTRTRFAGEALASGGTLGRRSCSRL